MTDLQRRRPRLTQDKENANRTARYLWGMIAVIVDVFFVILETIMGIPIGRRLRSDVPASKHRRRWRSPRRGDSA